MTMLRKARQLLMVLPLLGMASLANAYDGESYVTCQLDPNGDNSVALRTCPKSSCSVVEKLGPDTFLLTYEPEFQKGWREVLVVKGLQDYSQSGVSGWIYGEFICEIVYPNKR